MHLMIVLALVFQMAMANSMANPMGNTHYERATVPSSDPFYQPPDGFESKDPGTILRQRSIQAGFLGLVPVPVQAYQLLYRTTAINGSAIAGVTTVFRPYSAITMTDRFVSFHSLYDSASTSCEPSYNYQLGAPQTDVLVSYELPILQAYLSSGYIVSSPDHEGPDAAIVAGRLAGMVVLDSMRAVSNFQSLGFSPKPKIVGIGYAGGATASGWAASLQSIYAPELPIVGWAAGGVLVNLTSLFLNVDGSVFSGLIPLSLAGLAMPSAYGGALAPFLDGITTPLAESQLSFVRSHCPVADLTNAAFTTIQSTDWQSLGPDLFYNRILNSILSDNAMDLQESETPTAPVFLYHALQDEILPFADVARLRDSWCKNGASIKFTEYKHGGHLGTEIVAVGDVFNFVSAAFAGTIGKGCSQDTKLSNSLNPLALGVSLEPILFQLINTLGSIGLNDENFIKQISGSQ